DGWTLLFWRGIFAGLFIASFMVWQNRRGTLAGIRAIGGAGLVAAALSALATILFFNAFRRTSVADVTIIFATAPFATAAIGRLWIGEREAWTTLAASTAALGGVVIMVGGAFREGRLLGALLAFGMTACLALVLGLIRKPPAAPILPR